MAKQWLGGAPDARWSRGDKGHVPLAGLDRVTVSALLRDLTDLIT